MTKPISDMNRLELRAACRAAGINWRGLTIGGMRDTLRAARDAGK